MADINASLKFACPTCAAAPNESCELRNGTPRFESHRERKKKAKDHKKKAKDHQRKALLGKQILREGLPKWW
jgi:hypothetical protein